MKINWRERIVAAVIHFLITAAVAGIAAAIIFIVWFPGALASMVGGKQLFLIVIGCDASLGPLISLVIYSSTKSRKKLIVDYCVIGLLQLGALIYGVSVVALSRPVFIAYDIDRYEIVTAIELDDADLKQGTTPEFRSKSWTGPRLVAIGRPTDQKEKNDLMFLEVAGKRAPFMPKYYRAYDTALDKVKTKLEALSVLEDHFLKTKKINSKDKLDSAIRVTGVPHADLGWLLVRDRFGFAVALVNKRSGLPVKYVAEDPT